MSPNTLLDPARPDALRLYTDQLLNAVGLAVIATDLNGRVTYWNRSAEQIYGWPASKAVGRLVRDLIVAPGFLANGKAIFARLAQGESWSGTFSVQRCDGTEFLAHVTDSPIRDTDGALVGIVGVSRDVTDQEAEHYRLAQREAQLAEAQRVAHIGSWEWELGTDQLAWSDEHFRIFGLSPTPEPLPLAAGVAPVLAADRPTLKAAVAAAIAQQGAYAVDVRVVQPDGSVRWILSRGSYAAAEGDRPARLLGTAQDITERKQVEERLRESEERYRALFDQNPNPVFSFDQQGRITSVNPAAETLSGRPVDELLGQGFFTVPEDHARAAACFERALTGQPQHVEVAIPHPSGRPVELAITLMPIELDGVQNGVFGIAVDVTAAKSAERALRESEGRLRLALEVAEMGTWDTDLRSGRVVWSAVKEQVAGLAPGTFGGTNEAFARSLHPDDRERILGIIADATASGDTLQMEYRLLRPDGSVRWASSSGRVYRDADGQALRMLGVTQDLTERKRLEEQREGLVRAEKLQALGQMASGVAHNLNQSLALIAGYSDLAQTAQASQVNGASGESSEYLQIVTRAAMDGGAMVKRLLLFARSQPEGPRERVDLGALLREVADLTAPRWRDVAQAEGRHISLLVEAEGLHVIDGWPQGLREAITNLVFNAVDALPAGGGIRLRVAREPDREMVEVTDTGTGMPPEVQAHLFEPFFTTKGAQGTGLGLSSVYGLVQAHGGQITVASQVGQGTTIRLSFPVPAAPDLAADQAPSASAGITPARHVLAVDDEPSLGRLVQLMLTTDGHTVDLVPSGEEALERLERGGYELVVTDLGLGDGMNGWDLAAIIRQRYPAVPVILATGWGAQIDAADAARRGVRAVVSKPYRLNDLRAAVAAAV